MLPMDNFIFSVALNVLQYLFWKAGYSFKYKNDETLLIRSLDFSVPNDTLHTVFPGKRPEIVKIFLHITDDTIKKKNQKTQV